MHERSEADRTFQADFEAGSIAPADFGHRAHIRLAYCYLTEGGADPALDRMREALRAFLTYHGIERSRYHETMTRAWILAVRHFMAGSEPAESADAFIDANPEMLDSKIMLTHYSADLLFSDEARARFVEPDLDRIPRYDG